MSLIPEYINNEIIDGSFVHVLPYCKEHCNSKQCKRHYDNMKEKGTGFYSCPNGFSTLVIHDSDSLFVFTCIRERDSYDKGKSLRNKSGEITYNPVLNKEQLWSLASDSVERKKEKEEFGAKVNEVNDLLHETRKLNAEIKTICDIVFETDISDSKELLDMIRNIHTYSFIVYNRFQYYDTVVNPALSLGEPYKAVVFKKFDKMRRLLKNYGRRNVRISIDSDITSSFDYKIYSSFETLLFILLENGIKYSNDNDVINVRFLHDGTDCLDVLITSLGPFCKREEIHSLGKKGFRGDNAKSVDDSGQGIGLHFAKRICEIHSIEMTFSSEYKYRKDDVDYGSFEVRLHFDRTRVY